MADASWSTDESNLTSKHDQMLNECNVIVHWSIIFINNTLKGQ